MHEKTNDYLPLKIAPKAHGILRVTMKIWRRAIGTGTKEYDGAQSARRRRTSFWSRDIEKIPISRGRVPAYRLRADDLRAYLGRLFPRFDSHVQVS